MDKDKVLETITQGELYAISLQVLAESINNDLTRIKLIQLASLIIHSNVDLYTLSQLPESVLHKL